MESGSSLFACSASSLTSKWMGEAEKLVKTLFQVARELSPSLVFLDEVDALLSSRKSDGEHEASRRLKTEFMVQMEGITNGKDHVLVLACTNCPWDVDSAVLRRFPRRIFVPMPDSAARSALLQKLLKKAGKHSIKKKQRDDLVRRIEGFSCSDIAAIASEASFGPIRSLGSLTAVRGARAKDVRSINGGDFENAIDKATRSVSTTQLEKFETWMREQSAG
jgi:spastin